MASQQIPQYLNMIGASGAAVDSSGNKIIQVPSQFRGKIKYININNLTDNAISVFAPHDDVLSANPVYKIGGYMRISLGLTQNMIEGVQLKFLNPTAGTYGDVKPLEIIWSDESLSWNHSLAQSYAVSGGVSSSVTVTNTPTVNVASPVVGGNVAVSVQNTPNMAITSPLSAGNNLAVDVQNIAAMNDYVTIPLSSAQNNAVTTLTAPAVAGKSNYVSYMNYNVSGGAIGASDVAITITDGATVIYRGVIPSAAVKGTSFALTFPQPIKITVGNAVTLSIGASGTGGTTINANMGVFNK